MQLNLPIIIGFALADSVNPVALDTLINLLKSSSFKSKTQGYTYISGYFISSFVAGLFLIPIVYLLHQSLSVTIHLLGVTTATFGLIELHSHFHHQLQPYFKQPALNHQLRTIRMSQKLSSDPTSSFFYGLTIAINELFLSRFLYLSLIAIYIITMPAYSPITMLALYNTIVITPMIIISLYMHKGLNINRFNLWQVKYHSQLHLGISLLNLILGLWLITS